MVEFPPCGVLTIKIMTLQGKCDDRKIFAMAAMQGLLSNPNYNNPSLKHDMVTVENLSKCALSYADELLKQLESSPMEKTNVGEDNELIIGLDEFKLIKAFYPDFCRKTFRSNDFVIGWCELMPVVEKIATLYNESFPSDFIVRVLAKAPTIDRQYMDVIALPLCTPIKEAYKSVVSFINWYNTTKGEGR